MSDSSSKLEEMVRFFELMERSERIEMLVAVAERFKGVPKHIAKRPYPEAHRVKECESQAYVWAQEQPDHTLQFYFAVENPQGVTAVATAVVLEETLSGTPPEEILCIEPELIFRLFGEELSLRKRMGLAGLVNRVKALAEPYIAKQG